MKILLTVHQFFPDYSSGTEVLTYSVACELKKRGHDVCVLTGCPSKQEAANKEHFDEYYYDDIHVYRFYYDSVSAIERQSSEVELRGNNHLAAEYFEKILNDFKPDNVHFFHLDRLGSGLIESAFQAGIPAFMTPTDFWAICPTGSLLLNNGKLCLGPNSCRGNCIQHVAAMTQKSFIGSLIDVMPTSFFNLFARFNNFDLMPKYPHDIDVKAVAGWPQRNIKQLNKLKKIISPNPFMSDMLIQYGLNPDLIIESAFGVGTVQLKGNKPRSKPHSPLNIGYIATLAPHKGCHILLEAYNKLESGTANLKIYGKMDDFPDYLCTLRELAGDDKSIEFCGSFPLESVSDVLGELDVLVVPSVWYENTPLIIYSAQDVFCPVIASNLPGISAVIQNEKNGLLFEAGNVNELEYALIRLVREEDLLQKLSANAIQPKSITCYVDELMGLWSAD